MRLSPLTLTLAAALALAPIVLAHEPPGPNFSCDATQNPHDYALDPSDRTRLQTRESVNPPYTVVVGDHNLGDCNGDTTILDYDGDYEFGQGGGFFPAGYWANDPTCAYGLRAHHGNMFTVTSSTPAGSDVHFALGADPTAPTLMENPHAPRTYACVTDGSVTPTVDADDWLDECVNTCKASGLTGGDGGYWVWIDCPPQSCSLAGHISAPL